MLIAPPFILPTPSIPFTSSLPCTYMLPSRNRVQPKRLKEPKSVALSPAPVLSSNSKRQYADQKQPERHGSRPTVPDQARTDSTPKQGRSIVADASKTASSGSPVNSTIGTCASSDTAAGVLAGETQGEQYTYITDENGYTWLYNTIYGQYYYYDGSLGTYVPYSQGGEFLGAGGSSTGTATAAAAAAAAETSQTKGGDDDGKSRRPKKRRVVRMAGGQVWEDATLDEWPTNDYRLFAGDLGPEVTGELLEQAFGKFRSLQRTHVVVDNRTGKSRGYGFLSFGNPDDFLAAWKEFNGKYVGSRPIKLRKSTWKDRNADIRKVKRQDKRAFLEYKQHKH